MLSWRRGVRARLSCEATPFGAARARPRAPQAASSGLCAQRWLCSPCPPARCSSAVTCANPLPSTPGLSLPRQGLWRELRPVTASPVPSSSHEHPLARAGSSLRPRVMSDRWHLRCSPGALGCGAGSARGHCDQGAPN